MTKASDTMPSAAIEVAVLGGGPAGAAAARLLADWGHRVTLLTRPAPAPPLAESLPPSCGKLLGRIGVLRAMNAAGFVRSTGHTVRWAMGDERAELFANGELGWQVRRDALDRVLLREARAAGARVHRRANVRSVTEGPGGKLRLSYEEGARVHHLAARWVIDCTGRTGLMSRGDSGRKGRGHRTTAVVGLWERRPGWGLANPSHTLVESYPGGWAWSVPVSATRRQVTVMLDPSRTRLARGRRLATTYKDELARTSMIAGLCSTGRLIGTAWARDASSYECASPVRGHVLLAGDAASFVDPLSSYGVKKALASAWLAAVVVHSVLADPALEAPALALFGEREGAIVAALRHQLGTLSGEAASAHAPGFWSDRATPESAADTADPDIAALRLDAKVRDAFEAVRGRDTLALVPVPGVLRTAKPMVEGNMIVLRAHLVAPAFPSGIRFIRNVDILVLAELAPNAATVPELFRAYNRRAMPVPLADLIGALAVIIARRIVTFA